MHARRSSLDIHSIGLKANISQENPVLRHLLKNNSQMFCFRYIVFQSKTFEDVLN